MTDIDPVHRLNAKEAKDRLATIVYSMAPESLLIKPVTLRDMVSRDPEASLIYIFRYIENSWLVKPGALPLVTSP